MLGAVMIVIVWKFDLQLPMQSMPTTTKVPIPLMPSRARYNIM